MSLIHNEEDKKVEDILKLCGFRMREKLGAQAQKYESVIKLEKMVLHGSRRCLCRFAFCQNIIGDAFQPEALSQRLSDGNVEDIKYPEPHTVPPRDYSA